MVEVVDRLPGVVVGRRCVDLADLLAAASAGLGDVALVGADLRGLDRDALAHLQRHDVRIIGASRDGDEGPERQLRQMGVARHIHLGTPHEEIADLLSAACGEAGRDSGAGTGTEADRGAQPAPEAYSNPTTAVPVGADAAATGGHGSVLGSVRGRVIAVWGPIGAPGRSTVAVNLASEIAAAGVPALLIDLDTYGASVAQLLSVLDEAPGLAAAARASELGTLDLPALARLAVEVSAGFRVLTGIPTPSRWTEVRASAVEHVIDLARSLAEVVVLDCGFGIEDDEELSYDTLAPRRNATTLVGLAEADDLLLVGAADPVGLQRMVRCAQAVGQVSSPVPTPVVNRLRASSIGPDPRRRVEESLGRFAGLEGITFLPEDAAATDAALLEGQTLAESSPEGELRHAIAKIAARFTGRVPVRATRRRSLLGRR